MTNKEAIQVLKRTKTYFVLGGRCNGKSVAMENFLKAFNMAIDALEEKGVVRCRDCEFREGSCCDYSAIYLHPNGYCNWGRKKEKNEDE